MREIKNVMKSVYNIVDKMEDRTGELEDKSFEITQSKEKLWIEFTQDLKV